MKNGLKFLCLVTIAAAVQAAITLRADEIPPPPAPTLPENLSPTDMRQWVDDYNAAHPFGGIQIVDFSVKLFSEAEAPAISPPLLAPPPENFTSLNPFQADPSALSPGNVFLLNVPLALPTPGETMLTPQSVPEPSVLGISFLGLILLACSRLRKLSRKN